MKETKINLNSLENVGSIQTNLLPDGCVLSAFNQNVSFHAFDQPISAFVKLPGRYKLPLQIDLTFLRHKAGQPQYWRYLKS